MTTATTEPTTTPTQIEEDIATLFNVLVDVPFEGPNTQAVADHVGIDLQRVVDALHVIRSEGFIEEEGWTIPNVRKGVGVKVWSIAIVGSDDENRLRDGFDLRLPEVVETARRLRGVARLGTLLHAAGSRDGRKWRKIHALTNALVEVGESVEDEADVAERNGHVAVRA